MFAEALLCLAGLRLPEPPVDGRVFVALVVVLPSESDRAIVGDLGGRKLHLVAQVDPDRRRIFERDAGPLIDPLFGELRLGPDRREPTVFAIDRIAADRAQRERLLIDGNGDGRIDPEREVYDTEAEPGPAEAGDQKRIVLRHEAVRIQVQYGERRLEHEFAFWLTPEDIVPPPREGAAGSSGPTIWFAHTSWLEGSFELNGRRYRLAFIDANHDARVSRHDRWLMTPEDERADEAVVTAALLQRPFRPLALEGRLYRLDDVSRSADRASVRDVGEAPNDDAEATARDEPAPDR